MDLVLSKFDDYLLDKFWARLIPSSSITSPGGLPNITPNFAPGVIPLSGFTSPELAGDLPNITSNFPLAQVTSTSLARVSAWPRDYIPRQLISLCVITLVGIHVLYFLFAWLSYKFIFNHDMMRHPKFLKNQVKLEIQTSLRAFPVMMLLTLPWFQAEVMGYSKVYDGLDTHGYLYLFASVPLCVFPSPFHIPQTDLFLSYLLFTDFCIYWVHRWLHLPVFYKYIHKPHHKWISMFLYIYPLYYAQQVMLLVPTPFASHAFHPLDGYLQSIPYHLFIFIFPIHRLVYLVLFVLVNMWSVFVNTLFFLISCIVLTSRFCFDCQIHDSDMITGHFLEKFINGPAHHTLHHLYFTVNYGQVSLILLTFLWF